MGWGATKSVIAAGAVCLAAGAVASLALAGCGGGAKPTSHEVAAAYLQVAERTREYTFMIDRASEDPPDRPGRLRREFRSFAGRVDHTATFLVTVSGVGPVPDRAFVLQHSLVVYESALRWVAKHAHGRGGALERAFRDVRRVGAEVRMAGSAWERALRADTADLGR